MREFARFLREDLWGCPFFRGLSYIFIFFLLLFQLACYLDRNPVVGAWQVVKADDSKDESVGPLDGLVFIEEKAIILEDQALAVSDYVFMKDRVVVLLPDDRGYILTRLNRNQYRFENGPMAGAVLRRK